MVTRSGALSFSFSWSSPRLGFLEIFLDIALLNDLKNAILGTLAPLIFGKLSFDFHLLCSGGGGAFTVSVSSLSWRIVFQAFMSKLRKSDGPPMSLLVNDLANVLLRRWLTFSARSAVNFWASSESRNLKIWV